MTEPPDQLGQFALMTASIEVDAAALSCRDRNNWHEKVRHSVVEFRASLCRDCRQIKFEEIPDPRWQLFGDSYLGSRRVNTYDRNCGLCLITSNRDEGAIALFIPRSASHPFHSPKSTDPLAVFELRIGRSFPGRLLSLDWNRALPSHVLGWPDKAKAIDFTKFQKQLDLCAEKHIDCRKPSHNHIQNLAVIDCQTRQVIPAPSNCDYVALSYIWGTPGYTSLVLNGFLQPRVDATIEDALIVTRQLGFKYIWIDRYCISEDEKDAESKNHQIYHMHLIYQNAQVTIIAAAGEDVTFGLPGVSNRSRVQRQNVIAGPCMLSSIPSASYRLLQCSKWMSRAWTLQEAVFSRRRLIFTKEQLFLECRHSEWTEGIQKDLVHTNVKEASSQHESWKPSISFGSDGGVQGLIRAIELYSRRDLTYDSDALNAFQGIMSAYEPQGIYHNWGIPSLCLPFSTSYETAKRSGTDLTESFVKGLCWRLFNICRRRAGFPSWSWAGWAGGVWYDWSEERAEPIKSTEIEVLVELEDGKQMSCIDFAQIFLQRSLRPTVSPFI